MFIEKAWHIIMLVSYIHVLYCHCLSDCILLCCYYKYQLQSVFLCLLIFGRLVFASVSLASWRMVCVLSESGSSFCFSTQCVLLVPTNLVTPV